MTNVRKNLAKRLLTYLAAFFGGLVVHSALAILLLSNPLLSWKYPGLAIFTGLLFPGGATPMIYYLNHIAQTWFPFLIAFLIARALTRARARFMGALGLYVVFLIWSLGMVWLDRLGVLIITIYFVGLFGTFVGGAFLYLWWVDPQSDA